MPEVCAQCTIHINTKSPGLQCRGFCEKFFHIKCVNISAEQFSFLKSRSNVEWKCVSCAAGIPPISPGYSSVSKPGEDPLFNRQICSLIKDTIKAELTDVINKQDDLLQSVNFCSDKITDFEKALTTIKEHMKTIEKLKAENESLKTDVKNLSSKLNDLEQYSRMNNIEIQGIPEKKDENVVKIFESVCKFLDHPIDMTNVEAVHRVQAYNKNATKNIIVRFTNRRIKNDILLAAKTKRSQLGVTGRALPLEGGRVFINEHLTPENKRLLREVRLAATEKGYKYVWINNANILIRKDDRSMIRAIKTADQLLSM